MLGFNLSSTPHGVHRLHHKCSLEQHPQWLHTVVLGCIFITLA